MDVLLRSDRDHLYLTVTIKTAASVLSVFCFRFTHDADLKSDIVTSFP